MRFKKFAAIILMSTMIGTMSLSGCGGVNKDAVAITMTSDDKDAIEVTMGYANFAARIQQAGYDSVFASYYGDDYWTNDSYAKDGKNMQESIKDSVLESIETQYLLEKHMSDYGVEITEEDQAAIKKAAEQFMSDNSKAALKEVGATQEYVERYLYLQTVEKRMKAAISATADTNVSVASDSVSDIRLFRWNQDAPSLLFHTRRFRRSQSHCVLSGSGCLHGSPLR